MNWRRRNFVAALSAGIGVGLCSRLAHAHPYHSTLTQARHKRKQGTLECSMQVDPVALQSALRRANPPSRRLKRLQIDKIASDDLDRLCASYLRDRFVLTTPQGQRLPTAFVGHELELEFAWLHFQIPVGKGPTLVGYRVEVSVFFEIAPAQVNRVQLKHAGQAQTMLLRLEHPSELIPALRP